MIRKEDLNEIVPKDFQEFKRVMNIQSTNSGNCSPMTFSPHPTTTTTKTLENTDWYSHIDVMMVYKLYSLSVSLGKKGFYPSKCISMKRLLNKPDFGFCNILTA